MMSMVGSDQILVSLQTRFLQHNNAHSVKVHEQELCSFLLLLNCCYSEKIKNQLKSIFACQSVSQSVRVGWLVLARCCLFLYKGPSRASTFAFHESASRLFNTKTSSMLSSSLLSSSLSSLSSRCCQRSSLSFKHKVHFS